MCLACLCVSHAAGGIYTIIGVRVVIKSIKMDLRVCVCVCVCVCARQEPCVCLQYACSAGLCGHLETYFGVGP